MSMPGQLEVAIGADISPLEKGLAAARSEIGNFGASIAATGKLAGGGYAAGIDKAGAATDDFTKFIKTQRQENRLQNFVFRESMGAVSSLAFGMIALTSATGSNSKATQQLNRVFTSTFASFQGVSFGLQALNLVSPQVATGIGAIVAVGVGLLSFLGGAKKGFADLLPEIRAANEAMATYNAILERRTKDVAETTSKRLQSELNVRIYMIQQIETRLGRIEEELATADDDQKKVLETEKDRLTKRHAAEWSFLQAIITEQKTRGTILGTMESELKLLELYKSRATDLGQIWWANAQIQTKTLELQMAKRGTSLAYEMKYVDKLKERNTALKVSEELYRKLGTSMRIGPPVEMIDLDKVGIGMQMIIAELDGVHQSEMKFLGDLGQNFSLLEAGMRDIGLRSQSALSKVIQMAQYAIRVAEILSAINAGKVNTGMGGMGIFSSILSIIGILSMQHGGVAYGPSLALVGDYAGARSNPEVIAPLSDLRGLETRKVQVEVVGRVSGRDIVFITDKVRDEMGRVTG
jgi:hypothetical protein